jgi:hypothetical protein
VSTRRTIAVRLRVSQLEEICNGLEGWCNRLETWNRYRGRERRAIRQLLAAKSALDRCRKSLIELLERS